MNLGYIRQLVRKRLGETTAAFWTTTIAAGASMLINLNGSGTAFQQSVTLAIARTA